jgi:hypothetical protein
MIARYGLDQPLLVQYGRWLAKVVTGDFGDAIVMRQPVSQLIAENMPHSLRSAARRCSSRPVGSSPACSPPPSATVCSTGR